MPPKLRPEPADDALPAAASELQQQSMWAGGGSWRLASSALLPASALLRRLHRLSTCAHVGSDLRGRLATSTVGGGAGACTACPDPKFDLEVLLVCVCVLYNSTGRTVQLHATAPGSHT